jgi:hypothetical protein
VVARFLPVLGTSFDSTFQNQAGNWIDIHQEIPHSPRRNHSLVGWEAPHCVAIWEGLGWKGGGPSDSYWDLMYATSLHCRNCKSGFKTSYTMITRWLWYNTWFSLKRNGSYLTAALTPMKQEKSFSPRETHASVIFLKYPWSNTFIRGSKSCFFKKCLTSILSRKNTCYTTKKDGTN